MPCFLQECELYTCEASYIRTKEMAQSSHEIKHAISGGLLRSVSVSALSLFCRLANADGPLTSSLQPPHRVWVHVRMLLGIMTNTG